MDEPANPITYNISLPEVMFKSANISTHESANHIQYNISPHVVIVETANHIQYNISPHVVKAEISAHADGGPRSRVCTC